MFRTEIAPKPSAKKISLSTPVVTIGSCFSDHIGGLLGDFKFDILKNPFGVIFNPLSINKLLQLSMANEPVDPNGWFTSQGVNLHYDLHSQLGNIDSEVAKDYTLKAIERTQNQLSKANWLIITWGTAIVYERKDTGEVVANCHKVPADQFDKRLLSVDVIVNSFEQLMDALPENINVLLTISPVRHLKETLELNSVSKSTLRVAAHQLAEKYNQVNYFPAYELVLDDLRDYRFYKSDMLHPSDEAIDYVWNKFISCYFDNETLQFIEQWRKIQNALNHKPFNPSSDAHQRFLATTINQLNSLSQLVDITQELSILESQLTDA